MYFTQPCVKTQSQNKRTEISPLLGKKEIQRSDIAPSDLGFPKQEGRLLYCPIFLCSLLDIFWTSTEWQTCHGGDCSSDA